MHHSASGRECAVTLPAMGRKGGKIGVGVNFYDGTDLDEDLVNVDWRNCGGFCRGQGSPKFKVGHYPLTLPVAKWLRGTVVCVRLVRPSPRSEAQ